MPEKSQTVLVVDDSTVVLDFVTSVLTDLGCKTYTAANGKQAVDLASEICFDMILMDVYMPILDGFDATVQIRKAEEATGVAGAAIIAMTSSVDRERFLAAGFDDFLAKPVNRQSLEDMVTHWCGSPLITRQQACDVNP